MASKFERFASSGKGNGLRATHEIHAGELLYTAEPLAYCVSNTCAKYFCHSCFSRRETLLRCSQCKVARYCDVTCQKQAWSDHKRECKCLRSLLPRIPTDSVRLAARIIFRLLSPSQTSPGLCSLEEHESHLCDMGEERREGLSQLSSMLQLYIQQEVPNIMQELPAVDPLSLLAKLTCNCFTISDGELQEIGVGLYPSMSLLNHDCRPSCMMMFEGETLHLRAARDMRPAEELTISYIGSLAPTRDRQTQLEEQYHFTCQCQRCTTADMDPMMLCGEEEAWTPLREAIPRLENLQTHGDWEELLQECSSLLAPMGGAVPAVPDGNVYRLRVTDLALDACINLAQWDRALAYGTITLEPYRQYYPDPHPAHAIQLMRVAKLQHFLVHLGDAQHTLRLAYDIMKVTHGNQHPLTSDLIRKLEECRAELDRA
nr:histone-lysine N-methyltransferase SMYD3 isoform X1 [Oncorhynchus nerka]